MILWQSGLLQIGISHFNHDREFIWKARGFNSVQEMNKEIARRHNEVVAPDDDVYILGDCCLGPDLDANRELISSMNGRKYFVIGNHDTDKRVEMYKELGTVLGYAWMLKYRKYSLYLSHYPTGTTNLDEDPRLRAHVLNLYAHTHQKDNFRNDIPYFYHVGVDSHNCYPVLLDDVLEEMKQKNQECINML